MLEFGIGECLNQENFKNVQNISALVEDIRIDENSLTNLDVLSLGCFLTIV